MKKLQLLLAQLLNQIINSSASETNFPFSIDPNSIPYPIKKSIYIKYFRENSQYNRAQRESANFLNESSISQQQQPKLEIDKQIGIHDDNSFVSLPLSSFVTHLVGASSISFNSTLRVGTFAQNGNLGDMSASTNDLLFTYRKEKEKDVKIVDEPIVPKISQQDNIGIIKGKEQICKFVRESKSADLNIQLIKLKKKYHC